MSAASRTRVLYLDVACLIFGYLQILAAIALTVTAIWVACVESGCRYPIFSTISPRLPIRTLFVNIVWVFAALLVTGIHKMLMTCAVVGKGLVRKKTTSIDLSKIKYETTFYNLANKLHKILTSLDSGQDVFEVKEKLLEPTD
ncbi:hypothetical protein EVAR_55960_1 [Eumeta japonica]|uniref:Uncharacterized protein n=1 Tax=Eumeta variegata TaxID=151549 RepID=A0A4C1YR35_EUMVA|nr:hypothetical protein EVAR_55960_1 [Eumeta japonica]